MDGDVLAVLRGSVVVFLTPDGRRLARLPGGYHPSQGRVPSLYRNGHKWTLVDGRVRRVEDRRTDFRAARFDYCEALAEIPAGRLVGCSRSDLLLGGADGTYEPYVSAPPRGKELGGHWEHAFVSPDGTTLLLTWSGECESPNAFFAPATGGEPTTVTGQNWGQAQESIALGWSDDGRALVFFLGSGCGSGPRSGVYAVDGSTRPTLVAEGDWAAFFPG